MEGDGDFGSLSLSLKVCLGAGLGKGTLSRLSWLGDEAVVYNHWVTNDVERAMLTRTTTERQNDTFDDSHHDATLVATVYTSM